jgi:hypothetical protein
VTRGEGAEDVDVDDSKVGDAEEGGKTHHATAHTFGEVCFCT